MKKVFGAILATAALALAVSCTSVVPGYGFGTQAVVPEARIVKTGEATSGFLFGRVPLLEADISVSTAAKNGGITKIATVDSKAISYLGIWVIRTTIVTGE